LILVWALPAADQLMLLGSFVPLVEEKGRCSDSGLNGDDANRLQP